MANRYSNLYTFPADRPNNGKIPNGPGPIAAQSLVCAVAVLSGAIGNADVAYLRRMTPNEILLSIDIAHTIDSNITTANLVYRPTDGTADIVLLTGSALLDGVVNTTVAFAALPINSVVPDNGKEYDLCWISGAAGVASVLTHVIRSAMP